MWVTVYALALAVAVCFSAANLSRQLGQATALAHAAIQAESDRNATAGSVNSRNHLSQPEEDHAV
jgi:hypothetical protein